MSQAQAHTHTLSPFRRAALASLYEAAAKPEVAPHLRYAEVFERYGGGAAKAQKNFAELSKDEFLSSAASSLGSAPVERFARALADLAPLKQPNELRFDLDAEAVTSLAEEVMDRVRSAGDAVAAVPEGKNTFENTVQVLMDADAATAPLKSSVEFLAHVSPDMKLRDASTEADKKMTAFNVEQGMRIDVYNAVKRFEATPEAQQLSGEHQRALKRIVRDFKRNGLHLDEATRHRVKEIQTEIGQLAISFQKNLTEDTTKLAFTEAELEGLPADVMGRLERDAQGKLLVTLQYPDYYPAMKKVAVEETRRALEKAYNTRCIQENTAILERMVKLRHEHAQLLGWKNHSSYILDIRMAKTPEAVVHFLTDLSRRLEPLAQSEMAKLVELKRQHKAKRNEPFDGAIRPYDWSFFLNLREELEYEVDHEAIKQYFPLHVVTRGLLDIYQRLLGLRFTRQENPGVLWHEDVSLYNVTDAATNAFVGQFYLDLHPRQGKYGHAACFTLQPGCFYSPVPNAQRTRRFPVAAMVANFSKPTKDKPSLLNHNEVETYFHEFGHVMHALCSQAEFTLFSGTNVELDFVEAPSQMLENWCWERESLLQMCGHYEDESKKIPDDVLAKLVAAKDANTGLLNKRQIVFGLFDQSIHITDVVDTAAVYAKTLKEHSCGLEATPGTNFAANFAHLVGGYDSTYYGYMWSEVYSMDMFRSRFKKEGILNPVVGIQYRKQILEPAGSRDAIELLRDFLGREPNADAFLESKGLKA